MENTEQKSNKGNKIFFTILALLIFISVSITFYKIVILKDYQIVDQVSCNPKIEKCFVSTCDPSTDDTCPASTTEQTTYYKKISKNADTIYLCEKTTEEIGCKDELSCTPGEKNCSYIYCDPNNLDDGEECAK